MTTLIRVQGIVKTNLIGDSEIDAIMDALQEKVDADKLYGHLLVNFRETPDWDLVNWVNKTVEETCHAATGETRLRMEYGFDVDEAESNPAINSLASEFTAHVFASDAGIGKQKNKYAITLLPNRLLELRYLDTALVETVKDGKDERSFYNLIYPRRLAMRATARLIKINPEKTVASFAVMFHMVRLGSIKTPYMTVAPMSYVREFNIPKDRKERIGLLDQVARKMPGINTEYVQPTFDELSDELEYSVRRMMDNIEKADLVPDEINKDELHNIAPMCIVCPEMVTSFMSHGFDPKIVEQMKKPFKNLQEQTKRYDNSDDKPRNGRAGNLAGPRKWHPLPSEYDIAPEGTTNEMFPTTFHVKVPTDYKGLLAKHLTLLYAAMKAGNGPELDAEAKELEIQMRKHPELLRAIEPPEEEPREERQPKQDKKPGKPQKQQKKAPPIATPPEAPDEDEIPAEQADSPVVPEAVSDDPLAAMQAQMEADAAADEGMSDEPPAEVADEQLPPTEDEPSGDEGPAPEAEGVSAEDFDVENAEV
jgi:hypothetical protein